MKTEEKFLILFISLFLYLCDSTGVVDEYCCKYYWWPHHCEYDDAITHPVYICFLILQYYLIQTEELSKKGIFVMHNMLFQHVVRTWGQFQRELRKLVPTKSIGLSKIFV